MLSVPFRVFSVFRGSRHLLCSLRVLLFKNPSTPGPISCASCISWFIPSHSRFFPNP